MYPPTIASSFSAATPTPAFATTTKSAATLTISNAATTKSAATLPYTAPSCSAASLNPTPTSSSIAPICGDD